MATRSRTNFAFIATTCRGINPCLMAAIRHEAGYRLRRADLSKPVLKYSRTRTSRIMHSCVLHAQSTCTQTPNYTRDWPRACSGPKANSNFCLMMHAAWPRVVYYSRQSGRTSCEHPALFLVSAFSCTSQSHRLLPRHHIPHSSFLHLHLHLHAFANAQAAPLSYFGAVERLTFLAPLATPSKCAPINGKVG